MLRYFESHNFLIALLKNLVYFPYFRIHISYEDGSSIKCIRQHPAYDIKFANRYFTEQMKSNATGKRVEGMEVVMVSKQSKEVKAYINSQMKRGYSR
jgi:hypothetical protein